jgi:hypothetical protein
MIAAETDKWEKVVKAAGVRRLSCDGNSFRAVSFECEPPCLMRRRRDHAHCDAGSAGCANGRCRRSGEALPPPRSGTWLTPVRRQPGHFDLPSGSPKARPGGGA